MMATKTGPAAWTITGIFWCLALISINAFSEPFSAGLKALEREHYATAFRAWQGLAQDGESEAQNNIAYLYEHGYGV